MRRTWLIGVVMLACEQKDADPQGETETAASTATDATGAPDPTGVSGPGMSTSGATSGETSGGAEPTGGETSGGAEPTSGTSSPDPGGAPAALCQQFCDRLVACELDGAFDGCPCQPAQLSGAKCLQQWKLAAECFESDTCRSLESGESPCWSDYSTATDWCLFGEDGCEIFHEFGGDTPPDGCVYVDECLEAPSRRLVCDAAQCTCERDGAPAGTCAPEGVCDDVALVPARLDACCGR